MLGRRMGRGFKMVKYRSPAVNGKQFTLTQGKLQGGGGVGVICIKLGNVARR